MRKKSSIFLVALLLPIVGALASHPVYAGNDKPIGYFFMSGLFAGEKNMTYAIEDDKLRDTINSKKSYMTDVHGPYRTHWGAMRAMRELKRKSKENIYFTRIFKL
jgi:hypothetical protein